MARRRTHRLVGLSAFAAAVVILVPGAARGSFTVDPAATVLAHAIVADPSIVTGAAYVSRPPGNGAVAVSTDSLGGFPTGGPGTGYAVMTTGNAALAPTQNESDSSGANLGGLPVRGNTDYDVTVLRIDLDVPASANCLVGLDFRFYSEEYPEYVGTAFNDAFIAELDQSTWTTNGSDITAPRNFAFDPEGNPISINAAGVTSMTAEDAAGTTYDGATPLLTAATPITPGPHSLFLSIFDQGDQIYDSAVFIDNLRFGRVANVTTDCVPGADLANPFVYVGLGDSYSSGYGMEPFFPGTNGDSNECQRSELAFAPLLAGALGLPLVFHACQGAVTRDFYSARNGGAWGELPQLDYLNEVTGLVTFSIGGNDAHFSDVLKECILGFELLPFNTCHGDDKVTKPIAEAFARLDGQAATPAETVPYDTLLKDVRVRTPYAARVQVGYPPFFTADGDDRTFLPGGRCELVKKADQRWMVEKIAELNGIIARNAARNGFLFADPTSAFHGHEFCGDEDEWFYPLFTDGQVHPNQAGHLALANVIASTLDASDDLLRFLIGPRTTAVYRFQADEGLVLLSVIIEWPGSDVELSLTSPSGKTYTRSAPGSGVYHANGPTWEHFQIPNPEPGEWTVSMFGADVPAGGEETTLRIYEEAAPNQRPEGEAVVRREGDRLVLDGSGSSDPDGEIVSWNWYIEEAADDEVLVGEVVSLPLSPEPRSVTLVVTDDDGLTDFVTVTTLTLDVMPGSDDNPINVGSKGKLPVAVLSSATLDATTLDATKLALGPAGAAPAPHGVHAEDVDGDGRADLMLQFPIQEIGVSRGMTTLCLTGELSDERAFRACDRVRTVP